MRRLDTSSSYLLLRRVGLLPAILLIALVAAQVVRPKASALSIPLDTLTWTPIGPAPTVNGLTDYVEAASGRVAAACGKS